MPFGLSGALVGVAITNPKLLVKANKKEPNYLFKPDPGLSQFIAKLTCKK